MIRRSALPPAAQAGGLITQEYVHHSTTCEPAVACAGARGRARSRVTAPDAPARMALLPAADTAAYSRFYGLYYEP